MAGEKWDVLEEVSGELQGEILRGLLEAQGIPVWLSQEGAGRAYGLGVGEMGRVQILVPSDKMETAKEVLVDYYAGKFESDADDEQSAE